ncbi:Membrane protein implicated in regulation of membrane protease activity [Amycolatopsis arida]|uniref:Membrane protein implicated in regulation of membrane protease activity n=1 Tax=Amycolatopsis arida TaxID=587909 RepID=A0A1I5ZEN9_9PSEU|nr:NfeD family protein [Amycolatopsis arida]TDX89598.1 membrane protein implicated in regulation of membrane protease activity [Amycolatopsis arida]SFQ54954.1 Membrane protein implicated in regulation of membrane protease activity [Amycolatopsis arida]
MTAALIWLVVGIALIVAEVLSGDFVLLMLGLGALAGAGSAAISGNPVVDVAVFAVASVGLLVLARPALKRRFLAGPGVKTNTDALVGAQAVVLSTVDAHGGQVKLAGDVWSARSFADGQVIQPGTAVTVVEISGATAVVSAEP